MKDFCKIFQSEDYGQILIMNDTNVDDRPSVQIKFNCMEDFGVCSIDAVFNDDDKGHDSADKVFESMTEEKATKAVAKVVDDYLKTESLGVLTESKSISSFSLLS